MIDLHIFLLFVPIIFPVLFWFVFDMILGVIVDLFSEVTDSF